MRHRTAAQVWLPWHSQKLFGFPPQQQSEGLHEPAGDGDGGELEHNLSWMAPPGREYTCSHPAGGLLKIAFEPVHASSDAFPEAAS
jgi:hypothetical protein